MLSVFAGRAGDAGPMIFSGEVLRVQNFRGDAESAASGEGRPASWGIAHT
jgi:hypothetical protein